MSELVFYDIPSNMVGKAWSPNTWITRYTLNYKGLKYRTEWIEFPDIEDVCKKLGADPTRTKPDGITPLYTLPVLYDPSTNAVISDTSAITQYLDTSYPNTPIVLPLKTRGLYAAFQSAFDTAFSFPVYGILILPCYLRLTDNSKAYYRRTREEAFGSKLEDIAPEGEILEKRWKEVEAGLRKVASWYDAGGGAPFIGGETMGAADVFVAARLTWSRVLFGADSKEWERIQSFDGGRWGRFLQRFEQYETVV